MGRIGVYVKKYQLITAGMALSALCPVLASAKPVPRQTPVSGQVVSVKKGEDITFTEDKSKSGIFIKQDLKAGDILETNTEGALSIVFVDQTQIRLARNTTLLVKEVSAGSPSEIEMKRGSLWARAPRGKSKLTVRTPAATAAIRGTEWTISVEGEKTELQVASGAVEISNPQGQLNVSAGQAARAQVGQAPVRVVIVSHGAREQMLYYLSPDFIPKDLADNDPLKPVFEAAYLGDMDTSQRLIDGVLNSGVVEARAYWVSAKIGFLTGDDTRISDSLVTGLSKFPNDATLLTLQAEYKLAYLGRPDLGVIDARRAVNADPNYAQAYLILSKVLSARKAELGAFEAINSAIKLDPGKVEHHVQRADLYLRQNRPHAAKAELEHAFELEPNLSIARLGLGQVAFLESRHEEALKEFLAASADNPSYSLALLRLAEVYGHEGQKDVAEQQLDAADRLDPNTPFTPLYRTSLALHHYEAGKAIDGAQEALKRFQARGGLYENLSENRETGSNISRAFRFLDLEAWGRYYGDRTFDTFTATSYFDQVLNETPGPFFIRREDTSFNPQNGDDADQISSYLQGVVLDPLSVAQSDRKLQISKEHFVEGSIGGVSIFSDTSELMRAEAVFQTQTTLGTGRKEIPIAFNLKARRSNIEENTVNRSIQNGGVDLIDETSDRNFVEAYLGTEITPKDSIVAFATYRTEDKTVRESPGFLLAPNDVIVDDTESLAAFAFWTHKISDFNHITVGVGNRQLETVTSVIDRADPRPGKNTVINSDLLFANWTRQFGDLDVKIGAEGFWNTTTFSVGQTRRDEVRGYFDARYHFGDNILLSGKVGVLRQISDPNVLASSTDTDLEYDLGIGVEPRTGHWVRLAASQGTTIKTPFTLAPTTTLGLKGGLVPTSQGTALKSQIARWDAEWSDKFFTALEFQNQSFGVLGYNTPDGRQRASVNDGSLQRITGSANYLLGGNWAAHANYTRVWSEGSRGARTGDPLPFVPDDTATLGIVWTHPKRVSVEVSGKYVGRQESAVFNFTNGPGVPIGSYVTADVLARWEPYNKRCAFEAGLVNIFDNDFEVTEDVPAPGRTVVLKATARF